jgi:hypothetical protein
MAGRWPSTVGLAMATILISGLAPAINGSRADLRISLTVDDQLIVSDNDNVEENPHAMVADQKTEYRPGG